MRAPAGFAVAFAVAFAGLGSASRPTTTGAARPNIASATTRPPAIASSDPANTVLASHGIVRPTQLPPTQLIQLKIDGEWYDATAWADKHPGGRYVLEWADGHDVTGAFHTIHLFSSVKSAEVLKRLPKADLSIRPAPAPELPLITNVPGHGAETGMDRFMKAGERLVRLVSPTDASAHAEVPVERASGLAWQQQQQQPQSQEVSAPSSDTAPAAPGAVGAVGDSDLRRDLEAMLHRHFDSPAQYKATPEHWLRILGALGLFGWCYVGWVQGETAPTLALPFAQWLLFSPTVHEASHSTLSTRPWVNHAAAFCGLPFIYNPYIWWRQHILSHHQYTNDDALDVDLHHLRPARLHPGCEVDSSASGANFIWKGYFSTIGMAALWPVRNLQRKSTGRWYDNLITPKPDSVGDAEFAASIAPVLFSVAWPWLLVLFGHVNLLHGFLLFFYPWGVSGAIWTVMTQVSHVQPDCQQPPTGAQDDYFRWQIESAVDYSVQSEVVPKLTASLSLQTMHHVMPSVCGCHFAKLYPEYARICESHGVRLNTRKDLSAAWRSCIARVFELSSPELSPAWATNDPDPEEGPLVEHAPLIAYIGFPVAVYLLATPFF